jgi:hypothetical protein
MPSKLNINLIKSVDHDNEVKARCHIPLMINVWTRYGKPRLYCNRETDLNHARRKYSEPWLHGKRETDLITKT